MKQGGPIKRKTGLKQGGDLKRSPIKQRSSERSRVMKEDRIPLITALVEAGFSCEIGPVLEHHQIPGWKHCTGQIQGLHERRKRSAGGSLVNRNNLIPACNHCNGLIECEPRLIRELTGDSLVVREGDPEWQALGARQDP